MGEGARAWDGEGCEKGRFFGALKEERRPVRAATASEEGGEGAGVGEELASLGWGRGLYWP